MNYYPFHIGDFAAHTAHLSWEEDIAYRRMLDWYYLNEKALPQDVARVARLIRMPKSLPAIQVVLDEFFVKSDDGWHNKRADEELTSMLAKQEQQAIKGDHEAERMRRHRERRAAMFAALRDVGVVPAWDVAMKELQRLFDTHCNAHETNLKREQVVSGDDTATAIPTPTPTPTPTPDISPDGDIGADKPRKTATRAAQLPADFYPNEIGVEYAEKRNLTLAVELESFINWHQAKGTTMKDWQAAWRTWCDKAVEFGRAGQSGGNGARASPRDVREAEGKRVIEVLTGARRNERSERDITGEAVRLAG